MEQPRRRPADGRGSWRARACSRLPRLVGLVLGAFLLVEALLLGLGLLITRGLDDSPLARRGARVRAHARRRSAPRSGTR